MCVFMCGGRARCPRRTEFALMKTLPSPLMPRSLCPEVEQLSPRCLPPAGHARPPARMASCLALRMALLLLCGVLAPAVLTGKAAPCHRPPKAKKHLKAGISLRPARQSHSPGWGMTIWGDSGKGSSGTQAGSYALEASGSRSSQRL